MTKIDLLLNHLLCILALGLVPHGLCASEDTTQSAYAQSSLSYTLARKATAGQAFQYNAELTGQLEVIVKDLNDQKYWQQRKEIQRLICAGADPNVYREYDLDPLLCATVLKDDIELVQCCLGHGASINPLLGRVKPVAYAKSVAVLQCLVDYKADLNHKEYDGETLLHSAATHYRSPEVMAFLCNAGLNPNAQNRELSTPSHSLFRMSDCNKTVIEEAALFSWYGADYHSKNKRGESPLDVAQQECPDLLPQVHAIDTVVPLVKEQHTKEYREMLAAHIRGGPVGIVMAYHPVPSWGQRSLSDINSGIAQQTASRKKLTLKPESAKAGVKKQKNS